MQTIHEPARNIPVVHECDICVIGGSCTGVFAAARAAQLGARVAIIESNGFFGGVATASLVNIWHSIYDTMGERQIIGGLTTEVIERLRNQGAAELREPSNRSSYCVFSPAALILELDRLVTEASVCPFLHTRFCAPLMEDGTLTAIAVEDKSGRRAIRASYFIDATGDGDLIARMGLPCYVRDGLQPPTMCAILRGLGEIRHRHPKFSLGEAVFNPQFKEALERGFLWSARLPGSHDDTMVAGTRIFSADCSDADQLTQAEIEGRRQVRAIGDILREHFLDTSLHPVAALPTKIGIRETRHAHCLHQLTEQEVLTGKRFPDAIANGTYRVDVHHHDRPGITFRYLDGTEEYVAPGEPRQTGRWCDPDAATATFYQVPYASLVPRGSCNVLVAGRSLDADEGAFGAARVMVNCNQMGEAAGVAAHVALDSNISVADISPIEVRQTLAQHGSIVI